MRKRQVKAEWIWIERHRQTVDGYLRARRAFTLRRTPVEAALRVAVSSDYVLYVNGRCVGAGPAAPGGVDVYAAAALGLRRGRNVVAVLAHNLGVGTAERPRCTGGLRVELDVTYDGGAAERIVTDRRWRVEAACDFHRRAPRRSAASGFLEIRDTRHEPAGWADVGFRDRRWAAADGVAAPGDGARAGAVGDEQVRGAEEFVRPARAAACGSVSAPAGVTAVPFELAVPRPSRGEFYAGTFVHVSREVRARLVLSCDEVATVFVNNRQVLRQGYDEAFLRTLPEAEQDDYAGIHRGQGQRAEPADVRLEEGWNSLGIVLYDPLSAWGFAMRLEDAQTGRPLDAVFSPDRQANDFAHWHIVTDEPCPFRDGVIPEIPAPHAETFPDPAYEAAWEGYARRKALPRGATSLVAEPRGRGPMRLGEGVSVRYDFAETVAGYVELDVAGPAGAILDLVWSEALNGTGRAVGVRDGERQADRLILRGGGRQRVRLANRRVLRHLELIARSRAAAVDVYEVGVHRAEPTEKGAA